MGMTIEEAITRYKNNAEYERTHGNLQGCLEFKELVKWLEKYQKIEQMLYEYKDMIHAPCLMKGHICAVYEILNEVVEDGERG